MACSLVFAGSVFFPFFWGVVFVECFFFGGGGGVWFVECCGVYLMLSDGRAEGLQSHPASKENPRTHRKPVWR